MTLQFFYFPEVIADNDRLSINMQLLVFMPTAQRGALADVTSNLHARPRVQSHFFVPRDIK